MSAQVVMATPPTPGEVLPDQPSAGWTEPNPPDEAPPPPPSDPPTYLSYPSTASSLVSEPRDVVPYDFDASTDVYYSTPVPPSLITERPSRSYSSAPQPPLLLSTSSSTSSTLSQPLHVRAPSGLDDHVTAELLSLHRQSTVIAHENAFRSFVPLSVEHFLSLHSAYHLLTAPHASPIEGAMLFVDMSGFTPLSERLSAQGMIGIEGLSKHLNHYFGSMVDIIHRYEGDVTKFAGDALMILFQADTQDAGGRLGGGGGGAGSHSRATSYDSMRGSRRREDSEYVGDEDDGEEAAPPHPMHREASLTSSDDLQLRSSPHPPRLFQYDPLRPATSSSSNASSTSSNASTTPRSNPTVLRELTQRACSCALAIHHQFDGFVPENGVTLRLHSAISAGTLYGVHVGGHQDRWEWLLKGRPLAELGQAMKSSEKGQIVLHHSAMSLVEGFITAKPIKPIASPKLSPAPSTQRRNSRGSQPSPSPGSPALTVPASTLSAPDAAPLCHLLVSDAPPVHGAAHGHNTKKPHLTISVPPASPETALAATRPSPASSSIAQSIHIPAAMYSPHSGTGSPSIPALLRPTRSSSSSSPSYLSPSRPLLSPSSSSNSQSLPVLSLHDLFQRRSQLVQQGLSPALEVDPYTSTQPVRSIPREVISEEEEIRCERALRAYVPSAVVARVEAGHRAWLAEFRRVTTLFILIPEHDFDSADAGVRKRSLEQFQAVVSMIMDVCFKHKGDIRQLITDDKGTVMILLFGLQADWANPLRGVRAALEIQERIEGMKELDERRLAVGMTTGKVFCGTVGSQLRCEYTAVGDKVNTAARLMVAVPGGSGIYCDQDTVQATGNAAGISFKALTSIMVKGKAAPIPIFTPYRRSQSSRSQQSLQHIDLKWGSKMSGRMQQRQQVDDFLTRALSKDPKADRCNILYIEAQARGVGKSVLLSVAYAKCVELKVVVLIGVANDSESTPYLVFESMIPKMLKLLRDVQVGECSVKPPSAGEERDSFTGVSRVRVTKRGQEKEVNDDDDEDEEEEDLSGADWLHDPDVLAIPDDLKTNGQLCLLNDLCLTGDHRVLTSEGWKFIEHVRVGDLVMSFNIDRDSYAQEWKPVVWVMPPRTVAASLGKLYRLAGGNMDMIATTDHRMLVARLHAGALQARTPVEYTTVGDLVAPQFTYIKSTLAADDSYRHCHVRSVIRAGINRQPAVRIVIPNLERVCDWWYETDEQRGFLQFLGFWLGDGHLGVHNGLVIITQKKPVSRQWLEEELLPRVFPGWWRMATDASRGYRQYKVHCPPLYEYLRLMAVGPLGYNPRDDAHMRNYPHFTENEGLAMEERNSRYYTPHHELVRSKWTEERMLLTFLAAKDALGPECCWWCDQVKWEDGNEMLLCDGPGCQRGGHLRCANLSAEPAGDWLCPVCRHFADIAKTAADLAMTSGGEEEEDVEDVEMKEHEESEDEDGPLVVDGVDDEGDAVEIAYAEAVVDGQPDEDVGGRLRAEGKIVWFFLPPRMEAQVEEDDDRARCWWCRRAWWEEGNRLVFCGTEGCQWAGHQQCANLPAPPEGGWSCPRCRYNAELALPGMVEAAVEFGSPPTTLVVNPALWPGPPGLPPPVPNPNNIVIPPSAGVVAWNNGWWIIINGHWFYLKRWLGNQQQIASVYSQLSRTQAIALLDGFHRAHGTWKTITYDKDTGEPTGTWLCSNSSFPLIDHLQLIGQLAGASVNLSLYVKAGKTTTILGRKVVCSVDHWTLTFNFTPSKVGTPFRTAQLAEPVDVTSDMDARGYYKYEDDGLVYDITVQDNANFLTQRLSHKRLEGGRVGVKAQSFFSGNCSIVNFQHTEGISISLQGPSSATSSSPSDLVPSLAPLTNRQASITSFSRSTSHAQTPTHAQAQMQLLSHARWDPLQGGGGGHSAQSSHAPFSLTVSTSTTGSRDRSMPHSPATGGSEGGNDHSDASTLAIIAHPIHRSSLPQPATIRYQSDAYPNAPRSTRSMFSRSFSNLPPANAPPSAALTDADISDAYSSDQSTPSAAGAVPSLTFLTPPPGSASVSPLPIPRPRPSSGSQQYSTVPAITPSAAAALTHSQPSYPARSPVQRLGEGATSSSPSASPHEQPLSPPAGLSIPVSVRSNTGSLLHSRNHSRHSSLAPSPMQRTSTTFHPGVLLGAGSNSAVGPPAAVVEQSGASRVSASTGANRAKGIAVLMVRLLIALRDTGLSQGICIMIDNADNLDSASEQLILQLAKECPWLLFIFAARRSDSAPCSLKAALTPFKTRAEREKEKALAKLIKTRAVHPADKKGHRTLPNAHHAASVKRKHHRPGHHTTLPTPRHPNRTLERPLDGTTSAVMEESKEDVEGEGGGEQQHNRLLNAHRHSRYDVTQHSKHPHRRKLSHSPRKGPGDEQGADTEDSAALRRKWSQPGASLSVPAISLATSVSTSPMHALSPVTSPNRPSPNQSPNPQPAEPTAQPPTMRSSTTSLTPSSATPIPSSPMRSPQRPPARSVTVVSPTLDDGGLQPPTRASARAGSLMTVHTGRGEHSLSVDSTMSRSPSASPHSGESPSSATNTSGPSQRSGTGHYATMPNRLPLPVIPDHPADTDADHPAAKGRSHSNTGLLALPPTVDEHEETKEPLHAPTRSSSILPSPTPSPVPSDRRPYTSNSSSITVRKHSNDGVVRPTIHPSTFFAPPPLDSTPSTFYGSHGYGTTEFDAAVGDDFANRDLHHPPGGGARAAQDRAGLGGLAIPANLRSMTVTAASSTSTTRRTSQAHLLLGAPSGTQSSGVRHRTPSSVSADGDDGDAPIPLSAIFIELSGLNEQDMEELLLNVLQCHAVDKAVVQFMLERSNGIPLYAEEMALQLLHSHAIQVTPEGGRHTLGVNIPPPPAVSAPAQSPALPPSIMVPSGLPLQGAGSALSRESTNSGPSSNSSSGHSSAASSAASSPQHRTSLGNRHSLEGELSALSLHHQQASLPRSASHTFSIPHGSYALVAAASTHNVISIGGAAAGGSQSPHHSAFPTLPPQPPLQGHGSSATVLPSLPAAPALTNPAVAAIVLPSAAPLATATSAKEDAVGLFSPPHHLALTEPSSPHPLGASSAITARLHRPSSRVTQLQERESSSALTRLRSRAHSPSRPTRLVASFTSALDTDGSHFVLSSIPESMDEMIAAQIDALPPDLQLLLKMCSVFGRVVDSRCIRKVWLIYGARKQRKRRKSVAPAMERERERGRRASVLPPADASAAGKSSSRADRHHHHNQRQDDRHPPSDTQTTHHPTSSQPVHSTAGLPGVASVEFEQDMSALVEKGWLKEIDSQTSTDGASVDLEGDDAAESSGSRSCVLYTFKYAVAVNVAYNRMPFSFRGILHKTIGEWYEEVYSINPQSQLLPKLAFHWQQAASYVAENSTSSAPGSAGTAASPGSSSVGSSPNTPSTPKSSEPTPLEDSPNAGKVALTTRQESDSSQSSESQAMVLSSGSSGSNTPGSSAVVTAASSPPAVSHRQSLSSPPSSSTVLQCRHRAIHWLRLAGEHAAKQGARREATQWLGKAMEFIELLPDRLSLRWRRELLLIMTLYCPTYSVIVGLGRALDQWTRLCQLCEEVQLATEANRKTRSFLMDHAQPDSDDDAAVDVAAECREEEELSAEVTRSTFYALRGYQMALHGSALGSVDLTESKRVSAKMLVIAQNSTDWLMLAHALYLIAIQKINSSEYPETLSLCQQVWDLFLEHDTQPFVVNPLAPIDPAVSSMCTSSHAHCVLGHMSKAIEDVDKALYYAERNGEPVTYQYVLGMHCFILLQLDKMELNGDKFRQYAAYAQTSDSGRTSTVYEIVMALFQAYEDDPPDVEFIHSSAISCWERYQSGARFFIAFGGPLCQLLLLAGMWQEGLQFVADWHLISHEGTLSHFYPDCLRYEAMFLLQQAEAVIEEEQLQQSGGWRETSNIDGSDDEGRERSNSADGDHPRLQRPLSDPLPLSSHDSSQASSTSPAAGELIPAAESLYPVRETSESSQSTSPFSSVDVWALREEARQKLNQAVQFAFTQGTRLLEMKAIMTLIPLLRFLHTVVPHQQSGHSTIDTPPSLSAEASSASSSQPISYIASPLHSGQITPEHRSGVGRNMSHSPLSMSRRLASDTGATTQANHDAGIISVAPVTPSSTLLLPPTPTGELLSSPPTILRSTPQLSMPGELEPNIDHLIALQSPVSPYTSECEQHEARLRVLVGELEVENEGDFAILMEARDMLGEPHSQMGGVGGEGGEGALSGDASHLRQQSYTEGQRMDYGDEAGTMQGKMERGMEVGEGVIDLGNGVGALERFRSA